MAGKIVEAVPNISEGRNTTTIKQVADAVRSVEGVRLLDVNSDRDHNRTVYTLIGELARVEEASFRLFEQSLQLINMEEQSGAHPRIGAVDVMPFVPVQGVEMEECVAAAQRLGERLAEAFELPIYLYGEAAQLPERKNLAYIRKGQYEVLKTEINLPARRPDLGPTRMHQTAGASIIGARMPLIAFNVNLNTNRKGIADQIARAVRESSGGFKNVKAMGVYLEDRDLVQVSMNLENYLSTPIYRVFNCIKEEAKHYGVSVLESEIVGLLPQQALLDVANYYLRVAQFETRQVMENHLYE
ncbi:MAG: glutamate formimidoyltransferase [Halanaerobiales bacterium]|nr:glutamate formimidoyltransferase [Halanaerobiales bacterium]